TAVLPALRFVLPADPVARRILGPADAPSGLDHHIGRSLEQSGTGSILTGAGVRCVGHGDPGHPWAPTALSLEEGSPEPPRGRRVPEVGESSGGQKTCVVRTVQNVRVRDGCVPAGADLCGDARQVPGG